MREPKLFFQDCYAAAIAAAQVTDIWQEYLPAPPKGRLVVVGAGKGAAQLAQSFERAYAHPLEGVVVTRYGFAVPCERIKIIEAAHPLPDENSHLAAQALLQAVSGLGQDDLVIALITGGGSALLAAPLAPMTLEGEIAVNDALLRSGAPIGAMNTLRRHISAIKGGRLAEAASPAKLITYCVSDVPGDDPAEIASGPTISGRTTPEDARLVIANYALDLPDSVEAVLRSDQAQGPDIHGEVHILASAGKSLAAVEELARAQGLQTINLGDAVEGEARQVAQEHAEFVRQKLSAGWRGLILSGGETTVTLRGQGRGGRNTEYLLALSIALAGLENVAMFAADTDGIDGSEDNAGAFADGSSAARIAAQGRDAQAFLDANDAYSAFAQIGDIFAPGPSGTNVNDLRLIIIA